MLSGALRKRVSSFGFVDHALQLSGQGSNVSVFESQTTWPDGLFQSAVLRSDYDAAASNPLQGNDAERFGPARRNSENSMAIQDFCEGEARFLTREHDLLVEPEFGSEFAQIIFFRTAADNRQISRQSVAL